MSAEAHWLAAATTLPNYRSQRLSGGTMCSVAQSSDRRLTFSAYHMHYLWSPLSMGTSTILLLCNVTLSASSRGMPY